MMTIIVFVVSPTQTSTNKMCDSENDKNLMCVTPTESEREKRVGRG